MEILLIGNGFDLEHGLPTIYKFFLDFCKRVEIIYTWNDAKNASGYKDTHLDKWEMDESIKDRMFEAFNKRKNKKVEQANVATNYERETPDEIINELHTLIKDNAWIEYFFKCSSLGENWIDFESEISRVIQALDNARKQVSNNDFRWNNDTVLVAIGNASKGIPKEHFENIASINKFTDYLNTELNRLIRALEIYLADFVGKISVKKRSIDIGKLNPDCVLSFNYSDTYERIYDQSQRVKYAYIHGKADMNKNERSSNLVLGIDEYLKDDRKNEDVTFLTFKKFYQRIYKATDNVYLDWVDEIKDGYDDYQKQRSDVCPQHMLYIFGHSLDVTDRDVLKLLICNDNVQTKIYYYREDEDDKKVLGKLIQNLMLIMGQDELIRRTGGAHKTIEFIPQTISKQEA